MKECRIEQCKTKGSYRRLKPYLRKGLCDGHYTKLKKYGDPLVDKRRVGWKTKHELYSTYSQMKERCYNPNSINYSRYGGRGISICDRWLGDDGFKNFIEDMGDRPKKHTLDRIDNNKNYSPENCRWSSYFIQNANRSNNNEYVGISYLNNKWVGSLRYGKNIHQKTFKTREEAINYRKELEHKYRIDYK